MASSPHPPPPPSPLLLGDAHRLERRERPCHAPDRPATAAPAGPVLPSDDQPRPRRCGRPVRDRRRPTQTRRLDRRRDCPARKPSAALRSGRSHTTFPHGRPPPTAPPPRAPGRPERGPTARMQPSTAVHDCCLVRADRRLVSFAFADRHPDRSVSIIGEPIWARRRHRVPGVRPARSADQSRVRRPRRRDPVPLRGGGCLPVGPRRLHPARSPGLLRSQYLAARTMTRNLRRLAAGPHPGCSWSGGIGPASPGAPGADAKVHHCHDRLKQPRLAAREHHYLSVRTRKHREHHRCSRCLFVGLTGLEPATP